MLGALRNDYYFSGDGLLQMATPQRTLESYFRSIGDRVFTFLPATLTFSVGRLGQGEYGAGQRLLATTFCESSALPSMSDHAFLYKNM